MCTDFGVSVLFNSGVFDFCLQRIALVLQFADGPCALARLPAVHRDQCCLSSSEDGLFLTKSGFWSL